MANLSKHAVTPLPIPNMTQIYRSVYTSNNIQPLPTCWSNRERAHNIKLSQSGLTITYNSDINGNSNNDQSAVRSDYAIPLIAGIYYFETLIQKADSNCTFAIGISTKRLSLSKLPGWDTSSFGYHSDGSIYNGSQTSSVKFGPPFGENDTVGCGVDLLTNSLFFTRNGIYLGEAFEGKIPVSTTVKIYPAFGLNGGQTTTNFGDYDFKYAFKRHVTEERESHESHLVNSCSKEFMGSKMRELVAGYLVHHGYIASAKAFSRWSILASKVNTSSDRLKHENATTELLASKENPRIESSYKQSEINETAVESTEAFSINVSSDETIHNHLPGLESILNRRRLRALCLRCQYGRVAMLLKNLYPSVIERYPELIVQLRCRQLIEMMHRHSMQLSNNEPTFDRTHYASDSKLLTDNKVSGTIDAVIKACNSESVPLLPTHENLPINTGCVQRNLSTEQVSNTPCSSLLLSSDAMEVDTEQSTLAFSIPISSPNNTLVRPKSASFSLPQQQQPHYPVGSSEDLFAFNATVGQADSSLISSNGHQIHENKEIFKKLSYNDASDFENGLSTDESDDANDYDDGFGLDEDTGVHLPFQNAERSAQSKENITNCKPITCIPALSMEVDNTTTFAASSDSPSVTESQYALDSNDREIRHLLRQVQFGRSLMTLVKQVRLKTGGLTLETERLLQQSVSLLAYPLPSSPNCPLRCLLDSSCRDTIASLINSAILKEAHNLPAQPAIEQGLHSLQQCFSDRSLLNAQTLGHFLLYHLSPTRYAAEFKSLLKTQCNLPGCPSDGISGTENLLTTQNGSTLKAFRSSKHVNNCLNNGGNYRRYKNTHNGNVTNSENNEGNDSEEEEEDNEEEEDDEDDDDDDDDDDMQGLGPHDRSPPRGPSGGSGRGSGSSSTGADRDNSSSRTRDFSNRRVGSHPSEPPSNPNSSSSTSSTSDPSIHNFDNSNTTITSLSSALQLVSQYQLSHLLDSSLLETANNRNQSQSLLDLMMKISSFNQTHFLDSLEEETLNSLTYCLLLQSQQSCVNIRPPRSTINRMTH